MWSNHGKARPTFYFMVRKAKRLAYFRHNKRSTNEIRTSTCFARYYCSTALYCKRSKHVRTYCITYLQLCTVVKLKVSPVTKSTPIVALLHCHSVCRPPRDPIKGNQLIDNRQRAATTPGCLPLFLVFFCL